MMIAATVVEPQGNLDIISKDVSERVYYGGKIDMG